MPPIPSKEFDLEKRYALCRLIDDEYQKMYEKYFTEAKAIGGKIPVGGGDWMDFFFKVEALRGFLESLRHGRSIEESIKNGIAVSEISVSVWNTRRKKDYHVHRWGKCAETYLRYAVKSNVERIPEEIKRYNKESERIKLAKKKEESTNFFDENGITSDIAEVEI